MRLMGIAGLILAMALAGCAYQPVLGYDGIKRLHSVKVVYIQPSYILAIYQPDFITLMPVMLGKGKMLLIPVPMVAPQGNFQGDYLTNEYLSSRYQDEVTKLDARPQLLAAATQAISQVSWLANAPLTVVDHPMDIDAMRQEVLDSNVDAVVYLEPIMGLYPDCYYLRAGIEVTVYVNPRTGNTFNYLSAMIPGDQEIQLQQEPTRARRSILARSPKQLADVWFADDAAQLRGDIKLALQQIGPGVIHFLDGDRPSKGN